MSCGATGIKAGGSAGDVYWLDWAKELDFDGDNGDTQDPTFR
jgi:hypothetical protein